LYILTDFSPLKLLNEIKRIEKEMGRVQDSFKVGRYVDRIIDIDIVQYDDIIFKSNTLEIPHRKHLFEREFSKKLLKELNEKIKTQI
jgi:2-amino-4-hydroxy-6-hydroxymethyldihydropteridine diphosphokinase